MLIAKGYNVHFLLANGRWVNAPARYGMLHDPSGKDWPSCSGLIAPFRTGVGGELDDREARSYFGHPAREGEVAMPPRNLSGWKLLGKVDEILYTRSRPGGLPTKHRDAYYHPFEKGQATLYRRGRLLRCELGGSCTWNARGIVKP